MASNVNFNVFSEGEYFNQNLPVMSITSAKDLNASTKKLLDKEYSALIGETGSKVPGLGVIAFKDGEEVYSNFLGFRDVYQQKPMTRYTKLRVASVSKMFTMFTIMQLVDEGKIDLDTDVSEYLGFRLRNPNFPDMPITVRMLASHTSTLRDGKIYSLPPQYSIEEFFKPSGKFYDDGVHFGKEDKTYFKYCNLDYGIQGTIIERVTGERFDLYQKKHIFKQLRINADYIVGNLSTRDFDNLGTIYQKNDGGTWNENGDWIAQIDNYAQKPEKDMVLVQNPYQRETDSEYSLKGYKVGTNATMFSPQGGLRISFDELSHAMEMIFNDGIYNGKQVVRADLLNELFKKQWIYNEAAENGDTYGVMFSYGLGFYQIDGAGKARLCKDYEIDLVGHSGEAYGLISGFYFIPGTKNGVFFMTNGEAVEPDEDDRSFGKFSNGYIWEEEIMNPICKYILAK